MYNMNLKYKNKTVKLALENNIINNKWTFLDPSKKYVVITDTYVASIYHDLLKNIPNGIAVLSIKPGEKSKTLNIYEKIIRNLIDINFQKDDILIAFGGGVVCDLTGFIAKTFLNGVNYIKIPTTFASQIDSAISCNSYLHLSEKNILGVNYHPSKIIIDPNILSTLSEDEFNIGIMQLIKLAILKNNTLFKFLSENKITIDSAELIEIIKTAIEIKYTIIQKDEQENNYAKILKLGESKYKVLTKVSNNKLKEAEMLAISLYYELSETQKEKTKKILELYNLDRKLFDWDIDFNKLEIKYNIQNDNFIVNINKIGSATISFSKQ